MIWGKGVARKLALFFIVSVDRYLVECGYMVATLDALGI